MNSESQSQFEQPTRPAWLAAWIRLTIRYFGWCLLIGVPIIWLLGGLAYAGWIQHVGVFGKPVTDLPSLLLLVVTAPALAIGLGLVLGLIFIFPFQILREAGRRLVNVASR